MTGGSPRGALRFIGRNLRNLHRSCKREGQLAVRRARPPREEACVLMKTRILLTLGIIAACVALAAAGASTPRITSVAPNAIAQSAKPITITVQGEDFQPGLTLEIT